MLNKDTVLFIFEGARSEGKIVEKLEENFLGERYAIKCIFDAEIYQLYNKIKVEGDYAVDIVMLLKERSQNNAKKLEGLTQSDIAYIYMFFDYDAHSSLADDEKIKELLAFFDDETDNGKLYISYPMVEAIRHYKDSDSFRTLTVKCKRNNCPYMEECYDKEECLKEPHYKTFVPTDSRKDLSNVNGYTKKVWCELIEAHLRKANELVNNKFDIPEELLQQPDIFNKQLEKHINHKCPKVAVLSAFPLYVLDFFGCERLKKKLEE